MTNKKIAHPKKSTKRPPKHRAKGAAARGSSEERKVNAAEEQPLPEGLVERAAERAGIPTPDQATTSSWDEPREAAQRREAAERAALSSRVDSSLAQKLRELTSCGLYVCEDDDLTREEAILRWTAATLRAVSIAASRTEAPEDPTETRFDGEDTAIVLAGVITMLETGFAVSNDLRNAEQAVGGAS